MIDSMAGICEIHRIEKMFVGNGESLAPTCVKCVADAKPKLGKIQTVEDPGETYFNGKATTAKIVMTPKNTKPLGTISSCFTLEQIIEQVVEQLNTLPMPKDIKEFKRVQKAIKTLQKLVETPNGK